MSIFAFLKNIFMKEKMKKINEELYVGGQISSDDVKLLNDHGIKTIVCNRPDNEGQGQTNIDAIRQEAEHHGMNVEYIPFAPLRLSMENVKSFAGLLDGDKKPIFAYCLSGLRSEQIAQLAYEYREDNKL